MVVKRSDQTAMEYLRDVVSNLNYEHERVLDQLPSVEAVLEFAGLWTTYKTDTINGIYSVIHDGGDPGPLAAFVQKHGLKWAAPDNVVPATWPHAPVVMTHHPLCDEADVDSVAGGDTLSQPGALWLPGQL